MASLTCFQCSNEIVLSAAAGQKVGFREECPQCHADLHCCRNCAHYDRNVYNQCKEPQADVVREKERANFCDFFTPVSGRPGQRQEKDNLLAAAEALFKKK